MTLVLGAALAAAVVWSLVGRSDGEQLRRIGVLLAFSGVAIQIGVRVDVAGVGVLFILATRPRVRRDLAKSRFTRAAAALLVWLATSSVIGLTVRTGNAALLTNYAQRFGWGYAQTNLRAPSQLLRWGVSLLVVSYAVAMAKRHGSGLLLNGFVRGVRWSALYGLLQVAFQTLNLPWISGGFMERYFSAQLGTRSSIQRVAVGPIGLARLYGLGGEPKHTAALIAVLILALPEIARRLTMGAREEKRLKALLWLSLLLTFSTAAWVFVGVFLPLSRAHVWAVGRRRASGRRARASAAGTLMFAALLVVLVPSVVTGVLDARLLGRLGSIADPQVSSEPKDAASVIVLREIPIHDVFTGLGPGMADGVVAEVLEPYDRYKILDNPPTATYLGVRLLLEGGIASIVLTFMLVHVATNPRRGLTGNGVTRLLLFGSMFQPALTFSAVWSFAFALAVTDGLAHGQRLPSRRRSEVRNVESSK